METFPSFPLSIHVKDSGSIGVSLGASKGKERFPTSPYFFLDLGCLCLGNRPFSEFQIRNLEMHFRSSSQREGGKWRSIHESGCFVNNPSCFVSLWVELSCKGRCFESFARGRECDCDAQCTEYGKCCPDYEDFCAKGKHQSQHGSALRRSGICAPVLAPRIMSNVQSI